MEFIKNLFKVFGTKVDDSSPSGKVDGTDIAKVLRTTILVSAASGLAYFLTNADPTMFGPYAVFVVPVLTAGLDFLNKLVKANK